MLPSFGGEIEELQTAEVSSRAAEVAGSEVLVAWSAKRSGRPRQLKTKPAALFNRQLKAVLVLMMRYLSSSCSKAISDSQYTNLTQHCHEMVRPMEASDSRFC